MATQGPYWDMMGATCGHVFGNCGDDLLVDALVEGVDILLPQQVFLLLSG